MDRGRWRGSAVGERAAQLLYFSLGGTARMDTSPPIEAATPSNARPVIITVLCVVMFVGVVFAVPIIFSQIARDIGAWYPPLLAFGAVVGFVCMIGIWKMRKWAVYAYAVFCVVNQVVLLATGLWSISALVIPGIFIAIMFSQVSKMR